MKTIFVIGGMGAGKSTASRALASQGIPLIDLDVVGHEALTIDVVSQELAAAFGPQVLDAQGNVIRGEVAAAAFASEQATQMLNGITQPRIRELLAQKLNALEREGQNFAVVECSAFTGKDSPFAAFASVIVAVTTPLEQRIARAVANGWNEADVRARIARQVSDEARLEAADVVFENSGSSEQLYNQVVSWWNDYKTQEEG